MKIISALTELDDKYVENYSKNQSEEDARNSLPSYYDFLSTLEIQRHSDEDFNVYQVLRYVYLENNTFGTIMEHFIKRENSPVEYQGLTKPFNEEKL